MARIGHVPEILEVKARLEHLKNEGLISAWELPYENILTRLTAAIFFVEAGSDEAMASVRGRFGEFPDVRYRENHERKLSQMRWRMEFSAA